MKCQSMKATAASCLINLFPNWHEKKYWKELPPKKKQDKKNNRKVYNTVKLVKYRF